MTPCDDLLGFVDGELDAERAAAFRDHLRSCDACRTGLVEAVQLSAQLTTLTPRLGAPGPRERCAPAAAPWVPPLQSHVPSIPAWQRRPLWIGGGLAVAAAAASAWVCLHRPASDVFADLGTRPYEIRFAYGEAARHRPRHEAVLGGAGAASASDRVSHAAARTKR